MSFSQEVTLAELPSLLSREAERIASLDFTMPLRAVAVLLRNSFKENIQNSHDPDGKPFAPLKKARPNGTTHPLWATGRLISSLSAGAANVEEVSKTTLTVGTNVAYGVYHQEGTKHIPARPFIGIGAPLAARIDELLAKWLERQLAGP